MISVVDRFIDFIGGFLGLLVDFLMSEPIIYFVCMFLCVFVIYIIQRIINIKN